MGKAIEVACPGGRVQGQQIAGIARGGPRPKSKGGSNVLVGGICIQGEEHLDGQRR